MMNMSESRLQGLLQYLRLLNEMDNGSDAVYKQKQAVRREIEKELWIGEPEMASDDGEGENEGTSDFIQIIVDMQNKIESLKQRVNQLESNQTLMVTVEANSKRSADDTAREISDKLRKLFNCTSL